MPRDLLAERPASKRQPRDLLAVDAAPETPGAASDVVASGAAGFARGAADLAGLPGTLSDLGQGALQWGMRKGYGLATGEAPDPYSESAVERFFAGPTQEVQQSLINEGRNPISGNTLRRAASAITGGATDYQPYTTAGEYSRTVGEFLPGAMALGAGNVANAVRYGVAPAVASETAGQLTEDTALEPYARVAGAIIGGGLASRVGQQAAKAPSAAQIKQSANYADLKPAMEGARLSKDAYRNIVRDVWREANDFGLTTDLKSKFGTTLTDFMRRAESSGGASLYDVELLRRSLRNAAGNTLDNSAQALSGKLVDKLDEAVDALSASQIAASGATGRPVVDALKEARQAYSTGMKAQTIEEAMSRAQQAASGVENGLRVEFRRISNNPRLLRKFNQAEQEAIKQVAKGNFTSNALRWLGTFGVPIDQGRNFLGSLSGGGVGAAVGGMVGGPAGATIGGFAVPAIGTAAKMGSARATQGLADTAEALIKAGPQAQQSLAASQAARQVAGREAQLRAILQSQSAARVPFAKEPAR